MSQDEQRQFDHLQAQLTDANQQLREIRLYLSSGLGKFSGEARLYRTLFWAFMLLTVVLTYVYLLQ
jgi:hypothetical protein